MPTCVGPAKPIQDRQQRSGQIRSLSILEMLLLWKARL